MKLIYSGKTKEFTPELEERFGAKFAKLSKFIERRGEREAHIRHQVERHLHKIEIDMNFYDHALVCEGADADLETAMCLAFEKLEKQIVNLRKRWLDNHRDAKTVRTSKENGAGVAAPAENPVPQPVAKSRINGQNGRPKIFLVNYDEDRKPMTLDEALIEMETSPDYFVYRDSDRDCLSVLVRRPDGNLDLIQS
jgi:putative sigma-54 modulation protein